MTRINLFRTNQTNSTFDNNALDNTSTLIFAALLISCSVAVGCSSDKPKPVSSTNESPISQPTTPVTATSAPAPALPVQQVAKPVHKKIVHKAPPTTLYADKNSGVSFQYPRQYVLKTDEAATELVASGSIPMDFVQPGGVALAAVSLPESAYRDTHLTSAFFNVSVNKTLTAEQCSEFSVPQPNPASPADPTVQATAQLATPPISKLMIGDMELQSSETNVGGQATNGPHDEASKYYHVFENGACYEFALKVATTRPDASPTTESIGKPVDQTVDQRVNQEQVNRQEVKQEEVFRRLEKILATVKIGHIPSPEVNAEVKEEVKETVQPTPSGTPAQ